ncbi:MAG: hypothetical protein H7836_04775 [Magnetococcus sp. YQC-3]
MSRVFPFNAVNADSENQIAIFDNLTETAVFPLSIVDGEISKETLVFAGKTRVSDIDHKLSEMMTVMNKGFIKSSEDDRTILDCSPLFNDQFQSIKQLTEFQGYVKLNFKTGKMSLFEEIDPVTWTFNPNGVDSFEFHKEGRHPQSSHKIFAEVMQKSGFFFSQVFTHESMMVTTVDNFSKGIVGELVMNTFVGLAGQKYHRGIKMIQDAGSYVFPYLWESDNMFNIKMGIGHRYQNIQFVCPIMTKWGKKFETISTPIIMKITRGRGNNHTPAVTVSITHQEITGIED